jgi:HEXXH motif-containing protein
MPRDMLERIARGEGGSALAYLIDTQRSKNVLLTRALVDTVDQDSVRDAYRALRAAGRRSPDAVATVLTYPSVSNWAMHTLSQLNGDAGQARPGRLGLVALAAALRAGTDLTITFAPEDLDPTGLPLPTLGFLALPELPGRVTVNHGAATLTVDGIPYEIRTGGHLGTPDWHPVDRITIGHGPHRWTLAIDDPHRLAPGPAERISPSDLDLWNARLAGGWDWLSAHHPNEASDVRSTIRTLYPLPGVGSGHVSGTFRHASGCLAVSLPTDPQSTAVTFVHELQHLKLSAVMDLFELVDMSSEELGYAPWRSDPRPPSGLLHGSYAHLGVAAFWRTVALRETDPDQRSGPLREYVRWRLATEQVCADLLASNALTPMGRRFTAEMMGRLAEWTGDRIPASIVADAERANADHRARTNGA